MRPGHFAGVLTVVAKLFNLVQPDVAVFGQKDLQQATLIRALVRDLDFPIELDVAPIIRDADGLALSSRNRFLDEDQRLAARTLSRAIALVCDHFQHEGVHDAALLQSAGESRLLAEPGVVIDYLAIVDPRRLERVATASSEDYVVVAARVGTTRLLDNHCLGDPFPRLT
ncbi:MAG: pantoate--beta-alanine ligase [Gemmatimonadaceae bacterium]|nr:pantoate--beta-alanine ligase [Gemmatimonadaceae bacterium]